MYSIHVNGLFHLLNFQGLQRLAKRPSQLVRLMLPLHGLTRVVQVILNTNVLMNFLYSSETMTATSFIPNCAIDVGYLQKIVIGNKLRCFLFRERFSMVLFGDRRRVQSYARDIR